MDESANELKTVSQIDALDDEHRMQYLLMHWSMSQPVIEGRLVQNGDFWYLIDATDTEGNRLDYPLANLPTQKSLANTGVFIGPQLPSRIKSVEEEQHSRARFGLSTPEERARRGNPLLIKAHPQTLEVLTKVRPPHIYRRDDGSVDVDETLCRGYVAQQRSDLMEQLRDQEERLRELETTEQELATSNATKRKEARAIDEEIKAAATERDRLRAELEAKSKDMQEEIERKAAESKAQRGWPSAVRRRWWPVNGW